MKNNNNNKTDWDLLIREPQTAPGSRSGPGSGLQNAILGFEEPGLGTSSCSCIENWNEIWTSNPQSLDSKNLDCDLVWEPQAARGSRPGPGPGLQTPIFGFEEPGLRPGLGTSSCNRGSGLQTLNLGFEEEEEDGWDLVRESQDTPGSRPGLRSGPGS